MVVKRKLPKSEIGWTENIKYGTLDSGRMQCKNMNTMPPFRVSGSYSVSIRIFSLLTVTI